MRKKMLVSHQRWPNIGPIQRKRKEEEKNNALEKYTTKIMERSTRQGKTRQDKTRHDKTRQCETRQDENRNHQTFEKLSFMFSSKYIILAYMYDDSDRDDR